MFLVFVIFLQDSGDNSPASLSVPHNIAEQTSLEMETLPIIYSFLSHLRKLSNHKFSWIFLNFRLRHPQNLWDSENNWLNKISAKQSNPNLLRPTQAEDSDFLWFNLAIIWLTFSNIPRLGPGWSLCLPGRLKPCVFVCGPNNQIPPQWSASKHEAADK